MIFLKCTQKLLTEIKKAPVVVPDQEISGVLGSWHANLFLVDRHKCVIFTNDKTLFTFLCVGLKKQDLEHLDDVFRQNLFKQLNQNGFSQSKIEHVLIEIEDVHFSATNNRKVIGSMNELSRIAGYAIHREGGVNNIDLNFLNAYLNKIPMGSINMKYSIDLLRENMK